MKKRILAAMMAAVMVFSMAGCGSKADEKKDDTAKTEATDNKVSDEEETEIQVFIAASLKNVMDELAAQYNEEHPNVKITYNADSSGTLLTQIEEGYECDIFFSAAQTLLISAAGLAISIVSLVHKSEKNSHIL